MERDEVAVAGSAAVSTRTFLIADIRGYSTFTRKRGDQAAARLAARFAELARDAAGARGGRVIELRGDEALAVFDSNAQAVRAAVEFQLSCLESASADPELPLPVGVGIDSGEAIAVEDGFRGRALNLAARLCSKAQAGQVLVTKAVAEAVAPGSDLTFAPRGSAELKGFDAPVELFEAIVPDVIATVAAGPPAALPVELDDDAPLAGREHELRWLRGTWRHARRGHGRVVFVSGPAGVGKTRLAAELARWVRADGNDVLYAGSGGAAAAHGLSALDAAAAASRPTLVVLDQLDVLEDVAMSLAGRLDDLAARPVLVVGLFRSFEGHGGLAEAVARVDVRGDAHRALNGLSPDAVRDVVAQYAGAAAEEAPIESMARSTGGIPARVHEAAAEWARDEGGRRLAAAAEWLAQGRARQAAGLDLTATAIGIRLGRLHGIEGSADREDVCPYKGLAPFREEDAALFFGRERLIGELAARTVERGLLGIAGASGSGKSSVVMGGLLPSLAAGLLPGSERWRLTTIRPGERPIDALDEALAAPQGDERLVLMVDQFEELFTLTAHEEERRAFADRLVGLARDPDRHLVVLTVRGDHLGSVAPYTELADLLAGNLVLLGPMTADEVRSAIELPARRSGLRVEAALVEALVDEAADEPGALPLLSTALVELWQAREGGWLRMEAYERTGGIHGAVARLAEESYGRLDGPEHEAARGMLLRLAAGEGESVSRRRVPIAEFEPETDAVRAAVLARFVEDRLLTAGDRTVEVAHEALLREWPRVREWLDEDAEGRALRERLTEASTQWVRSGREASELLRGPRLSAAIDWATLHGGELNTAENEYLSASRMAAQAEVLRQRRTNRRLRGLLVGVAVFLVVALVAGSLALVQRGRARTAASRAEAAATVSLANTLGADGINQPRLDRGLLLAREAVNIHLSDQTKSDLLSAVSRNPRQIGGIYFGDTGKRPQFVQLSPDGKLLAVSFNENDVGFYDTATLKQLALVTAFGGPRAPLVFANHAPLFATFGDEGGDIELIDTNTFKPTGQLILFHPEYSNPNYDYHTTQLFFSEDDKTLWWGFEVWQPNVFDLNRRPDSVLESFSVATGQLLSRTLVDHDWQASIVSTEHGAHVDVVDGRGVFVYDSGDRRLLRTVPLHGFDTGDLRLALAVSPNERSLAIGMENGSVEFVSLVNGHGSTAAGGHTGSIVSVAFTPDGARLITVSADKRVVVWDVTSRSVEETLLGHAGEVHGVATDGRTLYTSSLDGTVFAWDLSGTRSFGLQYTASSGDFLPALQQPDPYFALSRDGRTLAAPQSDDRIVLSDPQGSPPHVVQTIDATGANGLVPGGIGVVDLSPDGQTLLATDIAGHVLLIDLRTGARRTLPGLVDWVSAAAFSPSGQQVAAESYHCGPTVAVCFGELALWNVSTGRLAHPLMRFSGFGSDVAFSPDGSLLALPVGNPTGSWPTAIIDLNRWKVIRRIHPDADIFAVFSPDGRTLATTGGAGLARLWDTRTWKELGQPFGISAGFGLSLAFDPTGRLLATGGTDGSTRILDVADPTRPVPFGPPSLGASSHQTAVRFTPDGSSLIVVDDGGEATVWPMRWQDWAAHACAVARRQLSQAEWSEFVTGRPYAPVCPSLEGTPTGERVSP